jgi:hypothetical protein
MWAAQCIAWNVVVLGRAAGQPRLASATTSEGKHAATQTRRALLLEMRVSSRLAASTRAERFKLLPRAIRHGQLAVTCRRPPDNGLHEPMRGHGAEYPGLATRDDAWESARALTPDLIAYASSRCAAARDEMPGVRPVRVRKCFEHGGVSGANRLLPLLRCPSTCASKCQSDVM